MATRGRQEAQEAQQGGRLACAVAAQQRVYFSSIDCE